MQASASLGRAARATIPCFTTILAVALQALNSSAQVTLAPPGDNSSVQVNPNGTVNNWVVDGNNILNPLSSGAEWFYDSVGTGTPTAIQNGTSGITSTPVTSPTADSQSFGSTYSYTSGAFSLQAVYTLTASPVGSGNSDLQENIDVKNTQATSLTFHFFQYANFTLTPPANVLLSEQTSKGVPLYTLAEVTGGTQMISESFVDAALNPGAPEGTITPSLTALTNTPAFMLAGPAVTTNGPGSAWILEWDVVIPTGGDFILNKDINVTVTPEPSALPLLVAGLGVFGLFNIYRRRKAA